MRSRTAPRGGVVQLGQRGCLVQVLHRAAHRLVGVRKGERPLAVGDLKFDQEYISRFTAQDGVERPWLAGDVNHALKRVALAEIAGGRGRLLDQGGLFGADQHRQVPTQDGVDGTPEQVGDVGADLTHLKAGLAHHREHTARLDAAGDVDRLAGAIIEVDGRADRDKVVLPLAAGHAISSIGSRRATARPPGLR